MDFYFGIDLLRMDRSNRNGVSETGRSRGDRLPG